MTKWYGNLDNRLEEGRTYCDVITVGTGMTEYYWSDREPYEVIAVKDQKHVTVRRLDHVHVGDGCMDNRWDLVSNDGNPCYDLEKRGETWYWVSTLTASDIEGIDDDPQRQFDVILAGFDIDKVRTKGKQTKRRKANVSFGVASYYYDYEF